jgi:hypothetical protein
VAPRPKSNNSFSEPASTNVDALKLPSRGVGVPVPSKVTFMSSARVALAQSNKPIAPTINANVLGMTTSPTFRARYFPSVPTWWPAVPEH